MKAAQRFSLFLASLALTGCVSGSFGDHREIEMLPLRPATDAEGKELRSCLYAAYNAQENHRKKTGHLYRHASELPVDSQCGGFTLSQVGTNSGYEIRAELRDDDDKVLWSINEQRTMEEHLDSSEGDGMDLEF